jgi:lysophospholipase L1-like esterase
MQMYINKLLIISFKILAILIVSFILSEIGLRLFNKLNPNYIFYDNSYNRYRGEPFSDNYGFKLNSKGFKDIEFDIDKGHRFRIIALGDSFAFGVVPYKYNYLTILEEKLNNDGSNVEVINFGIPRTGPQEYLSILINEGMQLNPDLVLLSFFTGNDFLATGRTFRKKKMYEYSYIAQLLNYIYNRVVYTGIGRKFGSGKDYNDTAKTMTDDKFFEVKKIVARSFYADTFFKKHFNAAVNYIEKINHLCKENGFDFLVVLIPDEAQIDASLQSEIINSFNNINPEQFDFLMPNKEFTKSLAEMKIDYIDLYSSFKSKAGNTRLYKPNDTHWNIAGNDLAADRIAEYLQLTRFQVQ